MKNMNRRSALKMVAAATAALSPNSLGAGAPQVKSSDGRPNVLCLMVDQQRFDTIAALGNRTIYTPNLDRLVARGLAFTNTYAPCPVCVPSRYSIRTGCLPPTTAIYGNEAPHPAPNQAPTMTGRCGPYLAQTMKNLGYRTFGIGKFHTEPWDEELGYDVHLHSEELYGNPDQRKRDSFASWIATAHPEFNFIEQLMGERTEMYYMPQMSPMPASVTVEGWAAAQAVEQIGRRDSRPYFGFVSFIGPHPPFAPPIPFNRLYDPDRMPNPIVGKLEDDFMDEQIPWMNYAIWAENVVEEHARVLKARYYGEITYIDSCIGRVLDAVEQRGDAENTVICFFADHGDHLGDHHGWQKESYFEASCHIPFPGQLACATSRRPASNGPGQSHRRFRNRYRRRRPPGTAGGNRPAGPCVRAPSKTIRFLRLLQPSRKPAVQSDGAIGRLEIHLHGQRWPRAVVRPAERSQRVEQSCGDSKRDQTANVRQSGGRLPEAGTECGNGWP